MRLFDITMYQTVMRETPCLRAIVRAQNEDAGIQAFVDDMAKQGYLSKGAEYSSQRFDVVPIMDQPEWLVYMIGV